MKAQYRYGAQLKGGWWENDGAEFMSPLHPACELVFRFKINGEIEAINNQTKAKTTITVLGLDHKSLTEDRKRVIEEFIYGQTGDNPISYAAAQRERNKICDLNRHGLFYEFCVAIRSALEEYVEVLRKRNEHKKHARRNR